MKIPKYNEVLYFIKGYKKVALRDTRGVLNKSNNYKFVKQSTNEISTILPSGTNVIEKKNSVNHFMLVKYVFKPNGDYIYSRRNNKSIFVLKNLELIYKKIRFLTGDIQMSKQKPENNTLFLPDGSSVKHFFNKQGKLVAWEKNTLGDTVKVQVRRLFNTDLGALFLRKEGNVYTMKSVSRLNTPAVKVTKYDLTNPEKLVVDTTTKSLNKATKKMDIMESQRKIYDSSMGQEFQQQKDFINIFFN